MEEIEQKIKEIIEENKKLKKEVKEKDYIINNCREKIMQLKETEKSLNRTITLYRSTIRRYENDKYYT